MILSLNQAAQVNGILFFWEFFILKKYETSIRVNYLAVLRRRGLP